MGHSQLNRLYCYTVEVRMAESVNRLLLGMIMIGSKVFDHVWSKQSYTRNSQHLQTRFSETRFPGKTLSYV